MVQDCKNKNNPDIERLVDFLRIISEENRLRIICFLQKNKEQCVCDIWKFLGLPQNLVSHHLKVLKEFSLLNCKKDGLKVYYCINKKELDKYKTIFENILCKNGGQNE